MHAFICGLAIGLFVSFLVNAWVIIAVKYRMDKFFAENSNSPHSGENK